jgi:hypothetical protein
MFSQQNIEKVQKTCKIDIINGSQKEYNLEDILNNIKTNIETKSTSLLEKLKNIQLYSTIGILIVQTQQTGIIVRTPGHKIIEDNQFFRDLVNLMNTEAFVTFKRRHMCQDLHSSLIYFELYDMINRVYVENLGEAVPPELAVQLLQTIMRTSGLRKPLIKLIHNYVKKGGSYKGLKKKLALIMKDNTLKIENK